MIFDEAKIEVQAGNGGNGSKSFRREKFVPLGGPDGGDGGRGGSVYLVADPDQNTLLAFRYKRKFKAGHGGNGAKRQMHGATGEDERVKVPVGTIVQTLDGEVIADLHELGAEVMVARGGRGGLGNVHFKTSTQQAPTIAQKGEVGETRELRLELRLIADVGLLGYPNVGKSTFLASVTRATPKIADYPFTTLTPNLGVASVGDDQSMVIADIPGLIEGAHAGTGLGDAFLKHVMRTLVLIHIIDGTSADPIDDFDAVNAELELFDAELLQKPQVVAVNKMDLPEARERYDEVAARFAARGLPVLPISAATGEGAREVLNKVAELLVFAREEAGVRDAAERAALPIADIRPSTTFEVTRDPDGAFRVTGSQAERIVAMTELENDESVWFLQKTLHRLGVTGALTAAGVKRGDTVRFGEIEMEWG